MSYTKLKDSKVPEICSFSYNHNAFFDGPNRISTLTMTILNQL
jgi:hypothetical protein